ncbi:C-X-C chemokine receptor type 3-like [Seriola aureovittata]|uniref:C-X-C chemokine receptor type 3-like n=1 Tax=Seriola aureovittata TaxID=2871759 RepID=UPI0024BDD947|nr:C-X-C chemokine receptor type 3-like [Seriola aureovittata]
MEVILDGFLNQSTTYDYTDYETKDDLEPKGSEAVWIPALYSVVLVVGLLGNVLLLAALALKKLSWSTSDTFVLHLGVADILLLLTLPLWAVQAGQSYGWPFGDALCKISGAVFNINFYCGIYLLVCICLDCCQFITNTTPLFFLKKPVLGHLSCLLVWVISLLLSIPDLIFLMAEEDAMCVPKYPQSETNWKRLSRLLHHTLGFLLPTATLIICCSCALRRLQCRSESLQKQRAIMVILPLVVVFFLCWMPYNITLIVDTYLNSSKKPHDGSSGNPEGSLNTALMVTTGLGCVHSCLRPLLYLGLCGNFRKRSLAMLRCAANESISSLWELGVGKEVLPDQSHEGELKQMTSVEDQQVQSTQCCDSKII